MQDKAQVLADVRVIIADQLGTELDTVSRARNVSESTMRLHPVGSELDHVS